MFSVQILCSSQFCFNILNCIVLLQKFTIVTFYFWYIFYFLCKKVRVDWLLVYLVYKWCIYCHVQHIIGSVGNRKSNGVTSSLCITTLQVFIVHQCDFLLRSILQAHIVSDFKLLYNPLYNPYKEDIVNKMLKSIYYFYISIRWSCDIMYVWAVCCIVCSRDLRVVQ